MNEIETGSVDMILCDIPYGEVNRKSGGLRNLDKGMADIVTFPLDKVIQESIRVVKGSIYIFCGTEQVSEIRALMVDNELSTRLGIWEKTNPSPMNGQRLWLSSIECCVFGRKANSVFNEHCKSSVWRHPSARGKLHPTMKPIGLMERLILASSNTGDTVLDFTMGSGTTGVACVNTNRKFIGIELDETYYNLAKERIINTSKG
jgi:DNA modification methylase